MLELFSSFRYIMFYTLDYNLFDEIFELLF